jgi:hypothetical protein
MGMKNFLMILLISIVLGEEQYFIKINNKEYEFELKDNEAANQIKSKLPFTVTMTNLNGNEVYYQFSGESFTTNTKSVGTINMGDIYLYQSNYLVLFYKTFSTSYSYTELGKLKDPTDLDTLIGPNNVEVQWFKNNTETEDTTKETTKDTTGEITKDSTEEISKDTSIVDTTKDSTKESIEATKDIIDEKTQETKDTVVETSKDTTEDTIKETAKSDGFDRYSFQICIKLNYIIWLYLLL